MAKRERGTGGLFKLKGCRFWYAQIYSAEGQPKRVSTRTEVKQEAQQVLRNLLVDKDRGVKFAGDVKKIHYEDLRAALITNYIERGNKALETMKDGEHTIWGLKAVDTFFAGYSVTRITTDAAREFAQSLLKAGNANLGVWVETDAAYAWLAQTLTVECLKSLLPETAGLRIQRYELPNLRALNFVIYGLLGRGVGDSTRYDPQAKSLGEWFRAREVDLPAVLLT